MWSGFFLSNHTILWKSDFQTLNPIFIILKTADGEALDESNPFFEDEDPLATEISNGSHETSHHNNPFEVENDNSNPFQVDEDDDYDNSGKNPFSWTWGIVIFFYNK